MINVALTGVRNSSPGFSGGHNGASSRYILNWGSPDQVEVLESAANTPSPPGSIIATFKGGGGGWGDPLKRDPNQVLEDVLDDFISRENAERDYGVVIDRDLTIDIDATRERRDQKES